MSSLFFCRKKYGFVNIMEGTAIVLFLSFVGYRKDCIKMKWRACASDVEVELISERSYLKNQQYEQELPQQWNAEQIAFGVEASVKNKIRFWAISPHDKSLSGELLTLRQLIVDDSSGNPEEKASLPRLLEVGMVDFWRVDLGLCLFASVFIIVLVLIGQLDHALNLYGRISG